MYETTTPSALSQAADISDYLAIHDMIRRSTRAFATAASSAGELDRRRAIALDRYWRGYAGELHAHHTIEDEIFMPALIERVPSLAAHIARVDADHHQLDALIEAGNAAFGALRSGSTGEAIGEIMWALDRLMCEHLDFEDDDVVPLFGRHFDQDEYDEMHARALKVIGVGRQALFTIPFVAQWMDSSTWAHMYDTAPVPLKVIYRTTRRRHERLTRLALGPEAVEALR
jgi:hemerythrin-like domain-containing protein